MATPSEQLLISSVLRNQDLPKALKAGVNNRMFHIYPEEFSWIEKFWLERGRTPDKATFHTKFPKFNVKVIDDTEFLSEAVRDDHKITSILDAVSEVVDATGNGDGDGALSIMHSTAMKISTELGLVKDGDIFRDHDDILNEFMMRKARYESTGISGIPTGFETFDERTGGFAPAEFHIVAARTGKGKSWSMQKFAAYAALAGFNVLYYALEQPRVNVMARIISLISPSIGGQLYTAQNLIRGKDYDAQEFQRFMAQLEHDVKGKLHVADGTTGRINTATVAAGIERNKPDIVFVDHITLMGKRTNDHVGVGEVADELTFFTNKYEMPIVAGAQLNRQGAQSGAGSETIAEADKIGQDASGLTFISQESSRVMRYEQRKYRNGSGGWGWWAKFDPDNGTFREIDYDLAQELIDEDEFEAKQGKE